MKFVIDGTSVALADGRDLEEVIASIESRLTALETAPPLPPPPPAGDRILLDDFATIRPCPGTDRLLWEPMNGSDRGPVNQSLSVEDGKLRLDIGPADPADGSHGMYFHFYPKVGGKYEFPTGYTQNYIVNGTWNPNVNAMRIRGRCNRSLQLWDVNGCGTLGTYIKDHDNPDPYSQGGHDYNRYGFNTYAGEDFFLEFSGQIQTRVSTPGSTEFPWQPDYFDKLTRFYLNMFGKAASPVLANSVWHFWDIEFLEKSHPLFDQGGKTVSAVSSVSVTHTGSGYEIAFCGPKHLRWNFDIARSSQSMRANGFESGAVIGQTSNPGSDYTMALFQSGPLPKENCYFAIRPQGMAEFYEMEYLA